MLFEDGVILIKMWFSITKEEQLERFTARRANPLKQWKFSPVDEKGQELWDKYTYYKQNDHQIYLGAKFFGNHYWLKALTSVNGEILKLAGEVKDPYPVGKLGVIEEGAYADILLVDGNPLEDITVIGGNEKWFDAPNREGIKTMRIIMKDGKIFKNTL